MVSRIGFSLIVVTNLLLSGCSSNTSRLPQVDVDDFENVSAASPFACADEWTVNEDAKAASAEPLAIQGKVIDETRKPVSGAKVACWVRDMQDRWVLMSQSNSDSNGDYSLDASFVRVVDQHRLFRYQRDQSAYPVGSNRPLMVNSQVGEYRLPVYVFAATPMDRVAWSEPQMLLSRSTIDCDLVLKPGGGLVYGVAVDEAGDPIKNFEVQLTSIFQQKQTTALVPYSSPLRNAGWKTRTDSEGRFKFTNLPPNTEVLVNRQSAWTNAPLRSGPQSSFTKSSPFALVTHPKDSVLIMGTIMKSDGQPAMGATIKSTNDQTSVDQKGEYHLEVSRHETQLLLIPPADSPDIGFKFWIDRKAVYKKRPQPNVQLLAGRWGSGTIVSASDRQPIQGVVIEATNTGPRGYTDEEGKFRLRIHSDCKTLQLRPGWLSDRELELYQRQKKGISIDLSRIGVEESLGELQFTDTDDPHRIKVRATFPDGRPVKNAKVRCWAVPGPESNQIAPVPVLLMQSHKEVFQSFTVTDENGDGQVQPCFNYQAKVYVSITYPEVDPKFFAEAFVPAEHPDTIELQLERAIAMNGSVTFNAEPLPHALIRANDLSISDQTAGYQVLDFVGVSDPMGNYQIVVPPAQQYELTVVPGILTSGSRLIGNEPAIVNRKPGVDKIASAPISILRGDRTVMCVVVNHLGRPQHYAQVDLLPDPGQVVLGSLRPQRDKNRTKLFGVPSQPMRVTATLPPSFRPGGANTKMKATTPIIQETDDEVKIVLSPAKFFPLKEPASN